MMYRNKHKAGLLAGVAQIICVVMPDLARLLKLEFLQPNAVMFFVDIVKREIKERIKTGKKRNDFIGAMMQVIFESIFVIPGW